MDKITIERQNQKDIEKGQKIVAAVFLATRHMSNTDTIKDSIRTYTTTLVTNVGYLQQDALRALSVLIGGASLAGVLSEKNSSIILNEMKHFVGTESQKSILEDTVDQLFDASQHTLETYKKDISGGVIKKTFNYRTALTSKPSFISNQKDTVTNLLKKNKETRQEKILSFINDRKSAVIKDIVGLFPDVSEKTLQRELLALIDSGKITKRGSKRWSIYMAVNALL